MRERVITLGVVALLVSASIAAVRTAAWGIDLAIPLVNASSRPVDYAAASEPIVPTQLMAGASQMVNSQVPSTPVETPEPSAETPNGGRMPGVSPLFWDAVQGSGTSSISAPSQTESVSQPVASVPSPAPVHQPDPPVTEFEPSQVNAPPSPAFAASSRRMILLAPGNGRSRSLQIESIYASPPDGRSNRP